MIKKLAKYTYRLAINLALFNPIFAQSTEEFQSANLHFVPFSEDNREEISAIMVNSDCFQLPYRAWRKGEKLTSFIGACIGQNAQTELGAWIIKINTLVIGLAVFIADNAPSIKDNTPSQENYTELKMGKIPLKKKFQIYYPQIINALINYAFETDSSLQGIKFNIQESHEFGLRYAMNKKLPCTKCFNSSSKPEKATYIFDISKSFYMNNKGSFK